MTVVKSLKVPSLYGHPTSSPAAQTHQDIPNGSQRRRRQWVSRQDMAEIGPIFTQYYNEKYTFDEISTTLRELHNFDIAVSTIKKWPAKWGLPNRNWSSDPKRQQLVADAGTVGHRRCPSDRMDRFLKQYGLTKRQRRVQDWGAMQPFMEAIADKVSSGDHCTLNGAQIFPDLANIYDYSRSSPERPLQLPDTIGPTTQSLCYISQYYLCCVSSTVPTRGSIAFSSCCYEAQNETTSFQQLPWRLYARYYHAFQMVVCGHPGSGRTEMHEAGTMLLKSFEMPTMRLLGSILMIAFGQFKESVREYVNMTLKFFLNAARSSPAIGPQHPLYYIIEAITSVDLDLIHSKAMFMRRVVEEFQSIQTQEFDATYECRELLILTLIQSKDLHEAEMHSRILINLSTKALGAYCYETYRARRLRGRVLIASGRILDAEQNHRRLQQDYLDHAREFEEHDCTNEWTLGEDLSCMSKMKGDLALAEQYCMNTLEWSAEANGETSSNTLRIFNDLVELLSKQRRIEELVELRQRYPLAWQRYEMGPK